MITPDNDKTCFLLVSGLAKPNNSVFSVIADSARQHYEEIKCNFSHPAIL